jgi:hypothetical protein
MALCHAQTSSLGHVHVDPPCLYLSCATRQSSAVGRTPTVGRTPFCNIFFGVQNLIKQYAQPVGSSFGTASITKAWGRQSVTDYVNPSKHNLALEEARHRPCGSPASRRMPWLCRARMDSANSSSPMASVARTLLMTAAPTAGNTGNNKQQPQWCTILLDKRFRRRLASGYCASIVLSAPVWPGELLCIRFHASQHPRTIYTIFHLSNT